MAHSAYEGDLNPEIADRIIEEAKKLFGKGETEPIAYSYPSGVPDKHTKTEWTIETKDLKKAIDHLIKGQPWPKFSLGPIELIISYDFKLVDPTTKKVLPNQQLDSSLLIWLSQSCKCGSDLWFPFEQPNGDFYNYLKNIDPFLPFKLEHKYLRLGRPNKNKTAHVFTKFLTGK